MERVLVADDEPNMRKVLAALIRRQGFEVVTAENGRLAAAALDSQRCHAVVTDMKMPEMDGMALLAHVRRTCPDVPVIICTGHSPLIDETKAKSIGIDGLVMKPIDTRDIAKTIRYVLDGQQSPAQG